MLNQRDKQPAQQPARDGDSGRNEQCLEKFHWPEAGRTSSDCNQLPELAVAPALNNSGLAQLEGAVSGLARPQEDAAGADIGKHCNGADKAISYTGQPETSSSQATALLANNVAIADSIDDMGIEPATGNRRRPTASGKKEGDKQRPRIEAAKEMRSGERIESPLQFVGSPPTPPSSLSSTWFLPKSPIDSLVAPPMPPPQARAAVKLQTKAGADHLIRDGGSGDRLLPGSKRPIQCPSSNQTRLASTLEAQQQTAVGCSIESELQLTYDDHHEVVSSKSISAKHNAKRFAHYKELEVEWMRDKGRRSLFKPSDCFRNDSRFVQESVRTSLVKKSIKSKSGNLSNRDSIGKTIRCFVDQFRSTFSIQSGEKIKSNLEVQLGRGCGAGSGSNSYKEISKFDANAKNATVKKRSKQRAIKNSVSSSHCAMVDDSKHFRTSVSTQSILNHSSRKGNHHHQQHETIEANSRSNSVVDGSVNIIKQGSHTKVGVGMEEESSNNSGDFIQVVEEVSSSNNNNNTTTTNNNNNRRNIMSATNQGRSYLARNKYIIEDKLKRQQEQGNAMIGDKTTRQIDERRSTYCSSIGGATTTDMNFDSSFSSANNCSDSNITCNAINRQCSREFNEKTGIALPFECRLHPSNDNNRKSKQERKPGQQQVAALESGSSPTSSSSSSSSSSSLSGKKTTTSLGSGKFIKRDIWDKNIEFLLAVIGFAVDLGNVWRFPYICYKNGGGAFLIPYTILFALGGLPIFYLEMSLGQYFSSGCLTVWRRICPWAKGIGYAMVMLNLYTGLYYNTVISWAVFFFVESFTSKLPWTTCDNKWNSKDCKTIEQRQALKTNFTVYNVTLTGLQDDTSASALNDSQSITYSSPTKDYFEREVLHYHLSRGIDDLGQIRTPLAFYLAVVFIFIYFAIWKGVKSTGKVVWVTALLPYVVLIPLLVRGVFLEGAWLGIHYYLNPQWMKLIDVDVWVEAAKQIYFSLGPGFGTLMALSSYNKFNHNCQRDTLIAAAVNYFASFISGFVIFAVLGYMATIQNVSISEVATEGPGLVFQVYPEGLAMMGWSSMWSVLFFIMVITLGIDSTFGGLESIITGLCDEYPRILRAHRGIFIGVLIIIIYLCSLPTTTNGGQYVITILESYGTSLSLLLIVLIETIVVCWIYGADKFCMNLEEMYGKTPGPYWRYCWKYISPTILLLIFFAACLQEYDKYHTLTIGRYTYPNWAPKVGFLMTGSSIFCIPLYFIYYLKTQVTGSFIQRLKIASRPIEGEQRREKEIYVGAVTDKIRDENDVHLDTVI